MVIVAAVDQTKNARGVVDQAAILGEKFRDPVHIVHVMKRSEAVEAESGSITRDDHVVNIEKLRARATSVAADLVDDASDANMEAVGLIGDPASEILEYAAEHDARYIVVSPEQKTQTGKLIFGSVTQSVLLNATCPVVSLIEN